MKIAERIKSAFSIKEKTPEDMQKELEVSEEKLKEIWKDVLSYVKRDLAYIWDDKVRKDFEEIKDETKKLALILKRLNSMHKIEQKHYQDEISNLGKLLYQLNRIEAKESYVLEFHKKIIVSIKDVEEEIKKLNEDNVEYNGLTIEQRLNILRKWEFPIEDYKELALILIKDWKNTLLIKNACSEKNLIHLFKEAIPRREKTILEYGLSELAIIVNACDKEQVSNMLYESLTKYLNPYLIDSGLRELAQIAKECGKNRIFHTFRELFIFCWGGIISTNEELLETGRIFIKITNVCDKDKIEPVFIFSLPSLFAHNTINTKDAILKYGKCLAKIANACDARNIHTLLYHGISRILVFVKTPKDLLNLGLDLITISNNCNCEELEVIFTCGLELCVPFSTKNKIKSDLAEILPYSFLLKEFSQHKILYNKYYSIAELKMDLSQRREEAKNPKYSRVDRLQQEKILCVHATNAFFGGDAGKTEEKKDPYENIKNVIENKSNYKNSPSSSLFRLRPEDSIVVTNGAEINGSIGVIYDYGNIYKSFFSDGGTYDGVNEKGVRYRKSDHELFNAASVYTIKNSRLKMPRSYNEVLLENWTVGAIFYTKGCQQEVIDRLKQIADEMSFKEYVNGAYWYSRLKRGVPKRIRKVFPIYEIDLDTKNWKIVYTPAQREMIKTRAA